MLRIRITQYLKLLLELIYNNKDTKNMNLVSPLLNSDSDRSHNSWKKVKAVAAISAVALSCIYLLADNQSLASVDEGMMLHSKKKGLQYMQVNTMGFVADQSSDLNKKSNATHAL